MTTAATAPNTLPKTIRTRVAIPGEGSAGGVSGREPCATTGVASSFSRSKYHGSGTGTWISAVALACARASISRQSDVLGITYSRAVR